jgi:hypothetical protein
MKAFDVVSLCRVTLNDGDAVDPIAIAFFPGSDRLSPKMTSPLNGADSAGTITVGTGLSLDLSNSGSSVFEITNPAFTAGTFDLVSGNGSVVFGRILNLAFSGGTYADATDVLQIFVNTGGLFGGFSAVNFSGLAAGQSATFNPTTGFITVVPEPSTWVMALAGLACGGYVVVRCRKQA